MTLNERPNTAKNAAPSPYYNNNHSNELSSKNEELCDVSDNMDGKERDDMERKEGRPAHSPSTAAINQSPNRSTIFGLESNKGSRKSRTSSKLSNHRIPDKPLLQQDLRLKVTVIPAS